MASNPAEFKAAKMGGLVGVSAQMQRVYDLTLRVSAYRFPVLILGETGTGKELVARSIHFMGPCKNEPFVPVDCAALVPALIESELFGFAKGAFTGAYQARQGLLASAGEGTIFLDEIGELGPNLQAKLLRVLQEHEFRPIGSTVFTKLKARVIAATHRDLRTQIKQQAFREDLYFRLNVAQIVIPPLRERKDDIPLLVKSFIDKYEEDGFKTEFSDAAMKHLQAHYWPGNVRELENVVERALALFPGQVINTGDLELDLPDEPISKPTTSSEVSSLADLERRAITRTICAAGGNKVLAARMLGIGKSTLYRRLK